MLSKLARDMNPIAIRKPLEHDRLSEVHREFRNRSHIERAEYHRGVAQTAAMGDENPRNIPRILIGNAFETG